jgi:hypothetical protein
VFPAVRKGEPVAHELLVPSGVIGPPIARSCSPAPVLIEGMTGLTIKVGGSFITLNPAGVQIVGPMIMLNSGGAPLRRTIWTGRARSVAPLLVYGVKARVRRMKGVLHTGRATSCARGSCRRSPSPSWSPP